MNAPPKSPHDNIVDPDNATMRAEYVRMARELERIAQSARAGPDADPPLADRLTLLVGQMTAELLPPSAEPARLPREGLPPGADKGPGRRSGK